MNRARYRWSYSNQQLSEFDSPPSRAIIVTAHAGPTDWPATWFQLASCDRLMTFVRAARRDSLRRLSRRLGGAVACLAGLFLLAADAPPQDPPPAENPAPAEAAAPAEQPPAPEQAADKSATAVGRLIRVPLPIVGNADTQVIAAVRKALAELPTGETRPTLVLEFSAHAQAGAGQGSDFERSLKLARFLSNRELAAAKTVAYIPQSLKGHAVLPAMACEEIVMAPEATLGQAGIDEPAAEPIDSTMRSNYSEIADRRRTIPAPVAVAMLDKTVELLRVETDLSSEFVLRAELPKLAEQRKILEDKTQVLSRPGELADFSGRAARELGFVKYLAADRTALARAYSLKPENLVDDPSLAGDWRPVRVSIEGPINAGTVSRVQRTIDKQVHELGANLICLWIDSPGGSLVDSMQLATYLADLDPAKVRVVAYVPNSARADAALVAAAADQILMRPDAALGGSGEAEFSPEDLQLARETLRTSVAAKKGRNWSLIDALVDPQLRVFRYTNREDGSTAYFSEEELATQQAPAEWTQGEEVTKPGQPLRVGGERARELGLARDVVPDFDAFKQHYGLAGDMLLAEPSWAEVLIEALAAPAVAWLLLLIGGAALYAELQAPGIGIGAFVAGVCFLLYFWSKYLGGTANWLEILLFAAGLCCILLELFVLPGSAIFGLGGRAVDHLVDRAGQPDVCHSAQRLPDDRAAQLAAGALGGRRGRGRAGRVDAPVFTAFAAVQPDDAGAPQ